MKGLFASALIISTVILAVKADTIVTDPTLGYSIYLPTDSWVRVVKSETHHQFYDTTYTFASQISIVRHAYSSSDYPTPESWTRANFIAYKLCVDYSIDPWGAMLFYDTASTVRQGTAWATECFTTFISLDTVCGAWSEYLRFTADKSHGWELYAIGDTTDMMTNIGSYAAILKMIQLPQDTSATIILRPHLPGNSAPACNGVLAPRMVFDPLGRKHTAVFGRAFYNAGAFVDPGMKQIRIRVK
ncbi:MAG: hypothetical protein JW768_04445 [Chitinispirillaceae bacterium]|nr:hypothetical protein [Chitinispirillaceae bacterium]